VIRARDVRAADLQEEPTKRLKDESWFSNAVGSSDPTKTAASGEHRSERSEPLDTASLASEAIKPDRARRCLDERASGQHPSTASASHPCWPRAIEEDSGSNARSAPSELGERGNHNGQTRELGNAHLQETRMRGLRSRKHVGRADNSGARGFGCWLWISRPRTTSSSQSGCG
jgi:hypothetical protein